MSGYPYNDEEDLYGPLLSPDMGADPTDPTLIASPVPNYGFTSAGSNPTEGILPGHHWNDPFDDPYHSGNAYSQAKASIDSLIQQSGDSKSKLQKQLDAPDDFSWSKSIGQALVTFLPALAGLATGGVRGGAIGAQAGVEGYKALDADQEKQRLENRTDTKEAIKEEDLTGRALTAQKAGLSAREAASEDAYNLAAKRQQGAQDLSATNAENRYAVEHQLLREKIAAGAYDKTGATGKGPATSAVFLEQELDRLYPETKGEANHGLALDPVRAQKAIDQKLFGGMGGVKVLGDMGTQLALTNQMDKTIGDFRAAVQKNPSLGSPLIKDVVAATPGSPLYNTGKIQVVEILSAVKQIENSASDPKIQEYLRSFQPNPLETMDSFLERYQSLSNYIRSIVTTKTDVFNAAGKDVSGIQELAKPQSTPAPTPTPGYVRPQRPNRADYKDFDSYVQAAHDYIAELKK